MVTSTPDPLLGGPKKRNKIVARAAQLTASSELMIDKGAEKNAKKPDKRKQDLDSWRRGRFDKNLMRTTRALQKAKRARADKVFLNQSNKSFSEKRRAQLAQWRKNRNASGS